MARFRHERGKPHWYTNFGAIQNPFTITGIWLPSQTYSVDRRTFFLAV